MTVAETEIPSQQFDAPYVGGRIVWVDDAPALVEHAARSLRALGFQVELRTPGMDLTSDIESFDLLILDIRWIAPRKRSRQPWKFTSGRNYGRHVSFTSRVPILLYSAVYNRGEIANTHYFLNPLATVRRFSKIDEKGPHELAAEIREMISEGKNQRDITLPYRNGIVHPEFQKSLDTFRALGEDEQTEYFRNMSTVLSPIIDKVLTGSTANWVMVDPATEGILKWGHDATAPTMDEIEAAARDLQRLPFVTFKEQVSPAHGW